ncbi:MFS transporter [Cellvibrio zantedeschiae]|uniref:MFS transporter n=1 Tax=Cellvibrio zantedeschiae TaxID=1237077 RepID=A0ABQ3AS78_9GAMM|nr:MFS transporter [Cellvibrio zantedeschiae]GGY62425.1 MFS transporter [Cellvibrio zantedeschiae]
MSYAAIILGLCQFLFMSAVAVGIAFNALVGKALAPTPDMATLPLFFMMGSTAALTLAMPGILAKFGYRAVFIVGALMGALGGLFAVLANLLHSFNLFCLAGFLMGLYQASAMYYRFAAADAVSAEHKSSAIAWVLNGGILAAFVGPMIGSHSLHFFNVDYVGSYSATALLAFIALPLLAFGPLASRNAHAPLPKLSFKAINFNAFSAILFCTSGYAMMGMVMLASPLAMSGCGYHPQDAASVIQWHLLGMFVPSLVTGKLIARFGAQKIAFAGVTILLSGCALALLGTSLNIFHFSLLVVGVGWNFMYMGGSTLLAQIPDVGLRSRLQSINEFITFAAITFISGLTGWIYESMGWLAIIYIALILLLAVIATILMGQYRQSNALSSN